MSQSNRIKFILKLIVKAKTKWSAFHRDVVTSAVEYAKDYYSLHDSKIVVRLVGTDGENDGSMAVQGNNKFIIWVIPHTSVRKLLETVFHEMTHVNQSVGGWKLHDENDTAFWKGRTVAYNPNNDDEYWNAPWEVEARKMGRLMRKQYTGEIT